MQVHFACRSPHTDDISAAVQVALPSLPGSGTFRDYLRAEACQDGTTAATQAFLHGLRGLKRTAEQLLVQPAAKCARTSHAASQGQRGLDQQARTGVPAQQPAAVASASGLVEQLSRHFAVRILGMEAFGP